MNVIGFSVVFAVWQCHLFLCIFICLMRYMRQKSNLAINDVLLCFM